MLSRFWVRTSFFSVSCFTESLSLEAWKSFSSFSLRSASNSLILSSQLFFWIESFCSMIENYSLAVFSSTLSGDLRDVISSLSSWLSSRMQLSDLLTSSMYSAFSKISTCCSQILWLKREFYSSNSSILSSRFFALLEGDPNPSSTSPDRFIAFLMMPMKVSWCSSGSLRIFSRKIFLPSDHTKAPMMNSTNFTTSFVVPKQNSLRLKLNLAVSFSSLVWQQNLRESQMILAFLMRQCILELYAVSREISCSNLNFGRLDRIDRKVLPSESQEREVGQEGRSNSPIQERIADEGELGCHSM